VSAGHEAQVFKDHLSRMEENVCRCGRTPSEVGEEFCQGYSLRLTGTRGLVGEGVVEGVVYAFGG